jgi:hypothetical protein
VTRILTMFVLLACLTLAACAESDKRSGDSPFGGWYGGFAGGTSP